MVVSPSILEVSAPKQEATLRHLSLRSSAVVVHYRRMKAWFIGAVASLGLWACGGLSQDLNKGVGTTEREVSRETGHDRAPRDAGVSGEASADSGVTSM